MSTLGSAGIPALLGAQHPHCAHARTHAVSWLINLKNCCSSKVSSTAALPPHEKLRRQSARAKATRAIPEEGGKGKQTGRKGK